MRLMRALPLLEPRRRALETCVFCPKLCRPTCPVSNAEPRETLIPWGKMSAAWMSAHGDVPVDEAHAAPAWACTDCSACTEFCEHGNPVADVLLDARDALAAAGAAPAAARRAIAGFARHDAKTRAAASRLASAHAGAKKGAPVAVFVGCVYLRAAHREACEAVDVATAATGGPVDVVAGCCGLPLRLAGDRRAFAAHAEAMARSLGAHQRVLVLDPGCALTLERRYRAECRVALRPHVELLVEAVATALQSAPAGRPATVGEPVRWHDPCQMSRGLGVIDAPRAVLRRALGRAPDELRDRKQEARCSGAGGLLPRTMPAVAGTIAGARLDAHARAGGGRVVTACGSSLLALRRRAAGSAVPVDDLVSWMARALLDMPRAIS
jgi:dimethylglycine catabolism B